jgi:hypothetical protein
MLLYISAYYKYIFKLLVMFLNFLNGKLYRPVVTALLNNAVTRGYVWTKQE